MPTELKHDKQVKISLLTGGRDPHYAAGLLSGLLPQEIDIECIGSDELERSDIIKNSRIAYFNLRGDQSVSASLRAKIARITRYYYRLVRYAASANPPLMHVLWMNKFEYFDRTLLNAYYKLLGKKLVFTAHNVNAGERDGKNTFFNIQSLKLMYSMMDHIFVHTDKMKRQLMEDFGVKGDRVTVIPFGVNNAIPRSSLTTDAAKRRLSVENRKVVLFFGNIASYKGLQYLIRAFALLKEKRPDIRLLIAGSVRKDAAAYWEEIQGLIEEHGLNDFVLRRTDYIPDEEVELYYKAADVLILPYSHIFQSGVIFLGYSFGLPVIASDVGCLKENIVPGETGYTCKPEDPADLAEKIDLYFAGDLFKNLESNRGRIRRYAQEKHSWESIGEQTYSVYKKLLGG